jgi:predicted house-cleaning noncanonical NTP pyrophosphatase (MazG superfamily)|tara:strand:+ start:1995 stop:2306 length:312 start_codon:yes stop_codon:yes gene_type:complete
MKIYNKLIRDKIPEIMSTEGKEYSIHIASEEEYKQKLKEKLLEEASEFLKEPSLEEIGDVAEVFGAILEAFDYSVEALQHQILQKIADRGSFKDRIVLEWTED